MVPQLLPTLKSCLTRPTYPRDQGHLAKASAHRAWQGPQRLSALQDVSLHHMDTIYFYLSMDATVQREVLSPTSHGLNICSH